MAGRDGFAAEDPGPLVQFSELHEAVAVDAGIRRAPFLIGADEAVDDFAPEIIFIIEDVIGKAQPHRDPARVIGIVKRAAGLRLKPCGLVVIQLHGRADQLMTFVFQKQSGDAGIHAAAHCCQYFHRMLRFMDRFAGVCVN